MHCKCIAKIYKLLSATNLFFVLYKKIIRLGNLILCNLCYYTVSKKIWYALAAFHNAKLVIDHIGAKKTLQCFSFHQIRICVICGYFYAYSTYC